MNSPPNVLFFRPLVPADPQTTSSVFRFEEPAWVQIHPAAHDPQDFSLRDVS